jgi:hypothetical protein
MKRPPYNRKPDGPWRDSGDRKPQLPEIDPSWRRRRQQREEPGSIWLPVVVTLGVLAAVWMFRYRGPNPVTAPSAVAAQAPVMEAERQAQLQARAEWDQRAAQAQAVAQAAYDASSGSSINGRTVRRCRYQASETMQTEPCPAPWVEVPTGEDSSRWQQVQEQQQMRLAAEAKLAEEQRRFLAATAGGYGSYASNGPAVATGPDSSRCRIAKAQRDEAYRIVGNDRNFNFIRHWQDVIYEACKS